MLLLQNFSHACQKLRTNFKKWARYLTQETWATEERQKSKLKENDKNKYQNSQSGEQENVT